MKIDATEKVILRMIKAKGKVSAGDLRRDFGPKGIGEQEGMQALHFLFLKGYLRLSHAGLIEPIEPNRTTSTV